VKAVIFGYITMLNMKINQEINLAIAADTPLFLQKIFAGVPFLKHLPMNGAANSSRKKNKFALTYRTGVV